VAQALRPDRALGRAAELHRHRLGQKRRAEAFPVGRAGRGGHAPLRPEKVEAARAVARPARRDPALGNRQRAGRRRQRRDHRHQREKDGRRQERDRRGGELRGAADGMDRIPQRDDRDQVREPAEQDERGKEDHEMVAALRRVGPEPQELPQRRRDERVGREDRRIASGMGRDEPGLPRQAEAVRHVARRGDPVPQGRPLR